jgi:hypothetical protein
MEHMEKKGCANDQQREALAEWNKLKATGDLKAKREFKEKWFADPGWQWVTVTREREETEEKAKQKKETMWTSKMLRQKFSKKDAKTYEAKMAAAGRMVSCTLVIAFDRLVRFGVQLTVSHSCFRPCVVPLTTLDSCVTFQERAFGVHAMRDNRLGGDLPHHGSEIVPDGRGDKADDRSEDQAFDYEAGCRIPRRPRRPAGRGNAGLDGHQRQHGLGASPCRCQHGGPAAPAVPEGRGSGGGCL